MPALIEKATGKAWDIAPDRLQAAMASGLYEAPDPDTVIPITSGGMPAQTTIADLPRIRATQTDVTPQTDVEVHAASESARIEREHGGVGGMAATFLEHGADALSLGGYGFGARLLGSDQYNRERKERTEANPISGALGTGSALLATGLATGAGLGAESAAEGGAALAEGAEAAEAPSSIASFLAKTPAGYVNRVGNSIRAAGEGAGLVGRTAAGAAAGVAEGGLYGAGNAVEQLASDNDPLTAERIAHVFADNVGSGALLGGAIGGVGELAISGAKAAARTIGDVADKIGAAKSVGDLPENLRSVEGVTKEQGEIGQALKDFRKQLSTDNPWIIADDKEGITVANKYLRRLSLNPNQVGANPAQVESAIKSLDGMLTGLEGIRDNDLAGTVGKLAQEDRAVASEVTAKLSALGDDATHVEINGKAAQRYTENILGKNAKVSAKYISIPREDATKLADLLASGGASGARSEAAAKLGGMIDNTQGMLERFQNLKAAQSAIKSQPKGLAATLVGHAGHNASAAVMALAYGHPLAAGAALVSGLAMKAVSHVAQRVLGAVRESGLRTSGAVDALLSGARATARATVPSSVTALNSLHGDTNRATYGEAPMTTAYKRANAALAQQVQVGPDGVPALTDEARRQLAAKIAPIAAINPGLADQVETLAAAVVSFLAVKAPKPPSFESGLLGPTKWQPSPAAIAKFARYVTAAKDPGGVEERAAAGTLTPEDVQVFQTLYPARLAAFTQQIAERLPHGAGALTLNQRISLQRLTGVPLVPALLPAIAAVIQGAHQQEPGTAGGFQAPQGNAKPPAYKSTVSLQKQLQSQYTPAQQRTA